MISIGRSVGEQVEVAYDLLTDRVLLIVASTRFVVWLTDAEAYRLGENAQQAAHELRTRRGERE